MILEEFNSLVSQTRLSAENRNAAKAVLVDGRARPEVEDDFGISRQRLHQIIQTVERVQEQSVSKQQPSVDVAERKISTSLELIAQDVRSNLGEKVILKEVEPASSKTFLGKIISRSDFHIAQDVGRGEVIIHSLGRLEEIPNVGKNVQLSYQNGRASVKEKSLEKQGLSR